MEELRDQLKNLEKQFFDIVPSENETGTNVQKSDILIKINKINAEISSIQNAYSDIFDNTAEDPTAVAQKLDAYYIMMNYRLITKELIDQVHKHNKKIFAYTVNEKTIAEQLQQLSIDGIITNYPDILT